MAAPIEIRNIDELLSGTLEVYRECFQFCGFESLDDLLGMQDEDVQNVLNVVEQEFNRAHEQMQPGKLAGNKTRCSLSVRSMDNEAWTPHDDCVAPAPRAHAQKCADALRMFNSQFALRAQWKWLGSAQSASQLKRRRARDSGRAQPAPQWRCRNRSNSAAGSER